MATDYVIMCTGQSNCALEGRGTGTAVSVTTAGAYMLQNDTYRRVAADPVGLNTNNRYTTYSHALAANSYMPGLLNALASMLSAGDTLTLGGFGVGGTYASGWASGATAVPPSQSTLFGVTKLRMIELMRNLANPKLLCHLIDQGEQNGDTAPNAADWPTSTTTYADEALAFATAMGWTWAKTDLRTFLRILPDLAATGFPNWGDVQTNQIAWAAARNVVTPNSVVTYKPPGGLTYTAGDNLHFETASLNTIGAAIGALILAAS